MNKIITFFSDYRHLSLTVMAASIGALLFAYTAQYGFNLQPCILCLYQRKPYFAVIVLALLAFLTAKNKPKLSFAFLLLCGVSFAIGTGIALYHSGVEQQWWEGTKACGDAALPENATIEQLKAYITNRPIVRCDVAGWKLFGLSMTAYNFLLSLFLTAFTFMFTFRGKRA